MTAIPFVFVALAIGVPLSLVAWHLWEQYQIGKQFDDSDDDSANAPDDC
jgi:hypothetical protein